MESLAKQRYYLLFIEQDLFDTWCLIRAFGSTITKRGRTMIQICESEQQAKVELAKIEVLRRKRGYEYAAMIHEPHFYLRPQSIAEIERLFDLTKDIKPSLKMATVRGVKVHPDQLGLF